MQTRSRILIAVSAMALGLSACDASPMGPSAPAIEDQHVAPSLAPVSDECIIRNGVFLCPPTRTNTNADSTATTSAPVESDECIIRNGVFLCPPTNSQNQ